MWQTGSEGGKGIDYSNHSGVSMNICRIILIYVLPGNIANDRYYSWEHFRTAAFTSLDYEGKLT